MQLQFQVFFWLRSDPFAIAEDIILIALQQQSDRLSQLSHSPPNCVTADSARIRY